MINILFKMIQMKAMNKIHNNLKEKRNNFFKWNKET